VLAIFIRIYLGDHKWKKQVTRLWTIEVVKLTWNHISKRKLAWKELMISIFVAVIVCSLHMPEKTAHRDDSVCCSSVCFSSLLDRFWWNFVWSYAIGGHPRLVHFSFLPSGSSSPLCFMWMRVDGSIKTQLSYDRDLLVWRWLHVSAMFGHLQVISCFTANNNKGKT
jgi:hypothetical protein